MSMRNMKTDTHKRCPRCGETKTLDQFGRRRYPSGTWGVHSYCKSCNRQSGRDFLITRYGITQADYDRMVEDQGGLCLICGEAPSGKKHHARLHVDHDHETGRVRGLLCGPCNTGIGHLQDDPEILLAAAAYLLRDSVSVASGGQ